MAVTEEQPQVLQCGPGQVCHLSAPDAHASPRAAPQGGTPGRGVPTPLAPEFTRPGCKLGAGGLGWQTRVPLRLGTYSEHKWIELDYTGQKQVSVAFAPLCVVNVFLCPADAQVAPQA